MAKSAFTAAIMYVHEFRTRNERTQLANIHGSGYDLLALLHGMLNDVVTMHVSDENRERVLIVENVEPRGRTIRFTTKAGRFGTEGEIVNVDSGETTHEFSADESPVTPTRNMFVVPERGEVGFLLTERYGGRGAATAIRELSRNAFRDRFNSQNLLLGFEAQLSLEAWREYVERADMKRLTINRYGRSPDPADNTNYTSVGKVACSVKPKRGLGRFAKSIKDGILGDTISPYDLVGIPARDEDDIRIDLDDGEQKRQLLLGHNEDPANLLYIVADQSAQRPDDDVIYTEMEKQISDDFARELPGVVLGESWNSGDWTAEQLAVRMPARRNVS